VSGLVARLIAGCARNRVLTLLGVAAGLALGVQAVREIRLDAIPDLSDVQVIVSAEWPGRGPDLVEDQVTTPVSSALLSAPRVRSVRGQSFFGLSLVYVIFEDGTDLYWARSRVLEYMDTAKTHLPEGVTPAIGPDATGVGWVFEYALVDRSGRNDLAELRSLQDWTLRYALASVPGVAEVASVGGFVRQYQVQVDPERLRAYGIPLRDVVEAVRGSNQDAGGGVIEVAEHEQVIRSQGYVKSLGDLENVPLRSDARGAPVLVRDVATVAFGPDVRRGLVELDGEGEAVGGIVVMRWGENALAVIDAVKARIESLRASLPPGVEIVTTYDRSGLIRAAVGTLRRTLLEEMAVVSLVILVFLLHARSALIPILVIPIGISLAFVPMLYQGLNANIMSLGGIAVAIGAMVDAAIIVVENAHRRLESWETSGRPGDRTGVIVGAMQEVGPSIFFALLVITVSFMPIFALTGTEGRLFKPLAFTKTWAMGFAAVLSVTLTPALASLLIRGRIRGEHDNPLNRWLVRGYAPVVRWVVRRRGLVVAGALLLLATAVPPFLELGSEFMPPLNEGTLLYMPTAPPGIAVSEASRVLQLMDRELHTLPEVERVFGKIGRAETPTDPAPLSMVETVVQLAPRERWRPGLTWESLVGELDRKLRYPGMPNLWWMPIQTRTEMLATGVRSQLGVKVFGDDVDQVERVASAVAAALRAVPGTRNAFAERADRGRELRGRDGRRRNDGLADRRGPRPLRDPGPLRTRLSQRPRCRRQRARSDVEQRAGATARAGGAPLHARAGHDPQRGRQGGRARRGRRRGPRHRRLRRAREAVRRRQRRAPRGHAPRVGRPVRVLRARESAAPARGAGHARAGRAAPLPEHALGRGDGDRPAGRPLLARRRHLAVVRARLRPLGRGLGGTDRAGRARRADGRRDALVSAGGLARAL